MIICALISLRPFNPTSSFDVHIDLQYVRKEELLLFLLFSVTYGMTPFFFLSLWNIPLLRSSFSSDLRSSCLNILPEKRFLKTKLNHLDRYFNNVSDASFPLLPLAEYLV